MRAVILLGAAALSLGWLLALDRLGCLR